MILILPTALASWIRYRERCSDRALTVLRSKFKGLLHGQLPSLRHYEGFVIARGKDRKLNATYADLDSIAVARTGIDVGAASIAVGCIDI